MNTGRYSFFALHMHNYSVMYLLIMKITIEQKCQLKLPEVCIWSPKTVHNVWVHRNGDVGSQIGLDNPIQTRVLPHLGQVQVLKQTLEKNGNNLVCSKWFRISAPRKLSAIKSPYFPYRRYITYIVGTV